MSGPKLCSTCGEPAYHVSGTTYACCKCHVEAGNPPADWHSRCMEAYNAKNGKPSLSDEEVAEIAERGELLCAAVVDVYGITGERE